MSTAQAGPPSGRAVVKRAIQGTGLYAIPLMGQRLASLILLPITTRVLAQSDYGMLSLLEQVSSVLSMLAGGNFSSSLGYFYFQSDFAGERRKVVGTSVLGGLLLGTLAGLICWPFTGVLARDVFKTADALRYLPFVLFFMPPSFLLESLFGWLRVEDRPGAFALGSLLKVGLNTAGIVVLVGILKMRVIAYLSTSLAVAVITSLVLGAYCFRLVRPKLSLELFLRMLRFTVPLGLSGVAMFVINFGDQFILRNYRSLAEVGLYSLAYRIGMIVSVAYGIFHAYWSAQVFQIMRRDDVQVLFARLFTYVVLGLCACSLGLVVCSRPAFRVLVGPDFQAAVPLIPLIVAAYFIRSIGEFLRCVFLVAGKPGYDATCTWIGMGVCVAAYFALIPRYGMWGAALATDITFVVITGISIVWTHRLNRYRVESGRLLKVGAAAGASLAGYFLVPMYTLAAQIGWSALLLAMFPCILWLLRFPTPGERQMLRSGMGAVVRRRARE